MWLFTAHIFDVSRKQQNSNESTTRVCHIDGHGLRVILGGNHRFDIYFIKFVCVCLWKQIEVKIRKPLVTVFKLGNSNANPICKAHHVSTAIAFYRFGWRAHFLAFLVRCIVFIFFFKVVIFWTIVTKS